MTTVRLALDVLLVFQVFGFAVLADLFANAGVGRDIAEVHRQQLRKRPAEGLHLMDLGSAFGRRDVTFSEGHEAVADAPLAFIEAVIRGDQ